MKQERKKGAGGNKACLIAESTASSSGMLQGWQRLALLLLLVTVLLVPATNASFSFQIYRYFPGFDWFFLDPITTSGIKFANDEK